MKDTDFYVPGELDRLAMTYEQTSETKNRDNSLGIVFPWTYRLLAEAGGVGACFHH